jgi:hypothetical protein
MKFVVLVVWLVVACACSDGSSADRDPCRDVHDHLVELQLQATGVSAEHREAHAAVLARTYDGKARAECAHATDDELSCLLGASDLTEAARCAQEKE